MQADLAPGANLESEMMPGHWLLARMGKRVLRPGGIELTEKMIGALSIEASDDVVEFAPGLGATAKLALQYQPATYTGVERDEQAAQIVRGALRNETQQCVVGQAEETGLPDSSASVVYGEAMLTMQPQQTKKRIIGEAFRLLKPGGRYAIHELSLTPDDLNETIKQEIGTELSRIIHHGVRPLTRGEWSELLESAGFEIGVHSEAPMHLLEPRRVIGDEGLWGALRFAFNVATHRDARRRVLAMRRVFRKFKQSLAAIALVGRKPE